MTLLYTLQGRDCALLVSDLLVRFVEPGQERATLLRMEKFRKNGVGDLIAYGGIMNSAENATLFNVSLESLTSGALAKAKDFRPEKESNIFYCDLKHAQVYAGTTQQPLVKLNEFDFRISADYMQDAKRLMDRVSIICRGRKRITPNFLGDVEECVRGFLLEAEKTSEAFGGFTSYLVSPDKIKYHKSLGKMRNTPSGTLNPDGSVTIVKV